MNKFLVAWAVPMLVFGGYTLLEYPYNVDVRGWWPLALGIYALFSAVYAGLFVWLNRRWHFSPTVTGFIHAGAFAVLLGWLLYGTDFKNPTLQRVSCELAAPACKATF